mgnify:FL=1
MQIKFLKKYDRNAFFNYYKNISSLAELVWFIQFCYELSLKQIEESKYMPFVFIDTHGHYQILIGEDVLTLTCDNQECCSIFTLRERLANAYVEKEVCKITFFNFEDIGKLRALLRIISQWHMVTPIVGVHHVSA